MSEIVHTPGVCGGRACIAGTRIPVWVLAALWRSGATDRAVLDAYPILTERELRAARIYVQDHDDEVARDIREQDDDIWFTYRLGQIAGAAAKDGGDPWAPVSDEDLVRFATVIENAHGAERPPELHWFEAAIHELEKRGNLEAIKTLRARNATRRLGGDPDENGP